MDDSLFPCALCSVGYDNLERLQKHATKDHPGTKRREWDALYLPKPARKVPATKPRSRRRYDQIERDNNRPRGMVENLVGLPWQKNPKTAEACQMIADEFLILAQRHRDNEEARECFLSHREYLIAYGARIPRLTLV